MSVPDIKNLGLHRVNIYYAEKRFITQSKYLLRRENIYYAEEIFITRRKYLLRRENIYYAEEK